MYCPLDEAFPSQNQQAQKGHLAYASCWHKDPEKEVPPSSEPVILGAQCTAAVATPPPAPPVAQRDQACMVNLHHCLSCPVCYQMLQLHFQQQPVVRKSRSRRRRRRMGSNVLNEEVPLGDIHITWATLLIILAGSAAFLLLWKLMGKK